MDKIKVVHSCGTWLNQTMAWLYSEVRHLDERIEPHIVCRNTANLDQFDIGNIHEFQPISRLGWYHYRLSRLLGSTIYKPFFKELRKIQPAVVHSHFGHTAWLEMKSVRKARCEHIVTFHGHDIHRVPREDPSYMKRYVDLFRNVTLVLCEGPFMRRSVMNLGCPADKVIVHHLGIPVPKIPFKPRKWDKGTPLHVLVAGTFVEKKGIPYALKALGKIRDVADLHITVVGDAPTGMKRSHPEKERILATIDEFDLREKTRLLGYRPQAELFKLCYDHHIFLSPSVTAEDGDCEGGYPVTIPEMAASGIPVVSTHHCDIPEVLADGDTGWLAEERDVDGLVDRLNWLTTYPHDWFPYLDRARQHIEAEFSAEVQGTRLSTIYEKIHRGQT